MRCSFTAIAQTVLIDRMTRPKKNTLLCVAALHRSKANQLKRTSASRVSDRPTQGCATTMPLGNDLRSDAQSVFPKQAPSETVQMSRQAVPSGENESPKPSGRPGLERRRDRNGRVGTLSEEGKSYKSVHFAESIIRTYLVWDAISPISSANLLWYMRGRRWPETSAYQCRERDISGDHFGHFC